MVKIFFDGGARPNPGRIEAAVVVRGAVHVFDDLGAGSNWDAEWRALICAVELVQSLALRDAVLLGDAAEVIAQAKLALRKPVAARGHAAIFVNIAAPFPGLRLRWIKRAQNLAGIALAARHPR